MVRRSWWPSGSRTRTLLTVLIYGHGDTRARARRSVAAGTRAVESQGRGRAHLRPWHRRQQGPAQHQHRRARGCAGGARPARLQRQIPDRDGRGGRLDRPARTLRAAQGRRAARRPADRLRRAADCARQADAVSRRTRRPSDRPDRRPARGRPPLRQLGRAAFRMPASCWRRRWPASPTPAARSRCRNGGRRCRRRSGRCSRASRSTAVPTARRSSRTGASPA